MGVVLEPFPFAGDGFTIEILKPGDQRDFGRSEQGLIDAGLVAASEAPAEVEGEAKPRAGRTRRTN